MLQCVHAWREDTDIDSRAGQCLLTLGAGQSLNQSLLALTLRLLGCRFRVSKQASRAAKVTIHRTVMEAHPVHLHTPPRDMRGDNTLEVSRLK